MNLDASSTLDSSRFSLLDMKMMGDRLAAALEARDMDGAALIAVLGCSKGTVYNILNNDTKPDKIRAVTLRDICRALRIRKTWLLEGRGPMDVGESRPVRLDPGTMEGVTRAIFDTAETLKIALDPRKAIELFAEMYNQVCESGITGTNVVWLIKELERGKGDAGAGGISDGVRNVAGKVGRSRAEA